MTNWLRRARGALGMGLTWAVGWAVAGVLIGVSSLILTWLPWDAFFAVFDAPLPTLAIPGFVGGALFSVVLGIAGRNRRFDDLSLPRFCAWGAIGGLLLSLIPATFATIGLLAVDGSSVNLWKATAVLSVPFVLLCTASAGGSLMLARLAQKREAREGNDVAGSGLGRSRTRETLEAGDPIIRARAEKGARAERTDV